MRVIATPSAPGSARMSVRVSSPVVSRAGLIEDDAGHIGQIFEEGGALDEDAVPAGHGNAGDGSGGCGKHQGAGAGRDQHRQGRGRVAAREPGAACHHEHEHHVLAGVALEQPCHGGLGVLRLAHQRNDFAERGLAADGGDAHEQAAVGVHGAGHHPGAGADIHGYGLAREAGHVEAGGALLHHAVGGHAVAGAQLDAVAGA